MLCRSVILALVFSIYIVQARTIRGWGSGGWGWNSGFFNPAPVDEPPATAPSPPAPVVTPKPTPVASSSALPVASSPAPIVSSTSKPPSSTPPLNVTSPSSNSNGTKPGTCSQIRVRKEWRTLSRQEQTSYIAAAKCLTKLPSKLIPGGSYSRYDDFENVHSRMRNKIHWIASFLPWHRHFMFLWEQALQTECGYTGSMVRWDWTQDSDDMTKAPIWSADAEIGFGTNGKDFTKDPSNLGGGAVEDGAFANLQLHYPDEHILERNYNLPQSYEEDGRTWGSQFYDDAAMAGVHASKDYPTFAVALEGVDPAKEVANHAGPHAIIHVIIGGDISPTSYAANELLERYRLFYLHHTNVDYHWWKWQNAQRRTRLRAYGGIATRGATTNTAKLTDGLKFLGMGKNPTVSDTMDTTAFPYCYKYE